VEKENVKKHTHRGIGVLEDEGDEDLTIFGEIIRECLLVPFVVGDCTWTKISHCPNEECHGLRGESAGNIVAEPLKAFTAVIWRQQEAVHSNRRWDFVFTSVFRVLTKRTKNLVAVNITDEAENPHAKTNAETDGVEGG